MGTHVDDIFGGFVYPPSYHRALAFRNYLCVTGKSLTVEFNMKIKKTPLPATQQIILGCMWDSKLERVRTSPDKRIKYLKRIEELLGKTVTTVKSLQKIHGNLNYAAEVTPFGRPFLAPLVTPTIGKEPAEVVTVPPLAKVSLRIWARILRANRGSSFAFILNNLPKAKNAVFVDASTEWGVGGCYGTAYYSFP